MKIAYLIDHLGAGGAQEGLVDLVEQLSPAQALTVISLTSRQLPERLSRFSRLGVPVVLLDLKPHRPRMLLRLRNLLAELRPDILHTRLEVSNHLGSLVALSLGAARPRIVLHTDNDPGRQYAWWHRRLGRFLNDRVDAHLAITPSVAQAADDLYGCTTCTRATIPIGIDCSRWRTAEPIRLAGVTIGWAGRFVQQKALDVLLRAFDHLAIGHPDLRLVLIGDGPLRASLERQADRERVIFLGHRRDMPALMRGLDLFVLPSRYEGQGLVLVEAMAAGVPIVATSVTGTIDVVEHEKTALLVPADDWRALADAMERLLADPALAERLAGAGAAHVTANFDRRRTAQATLELYRSVLGH